MFNEIVKIELVFKGSMVAGKQKFKLYHEINETSNDIDLTF